jgi:hypothetical protein
MLKNFYLTMLDPDASFFDSHELFNDGQIVEIQEKAEVANK